MTDDSPFYTAAKYRVDFTVADGAEKLKRRIEEHWVKQKIAPPKLKLVHAPFDPKTGLERVDLRSDMVDGLPRAALPHSSEDASQ